MGVIGQSIMMEFIKGPRVRISIGWWICLSKICGLIGGPLKISLAAGWTSIRHQTPSSNLSHPNPKGFSGYETISGAGGLVGKFLKSLASPDRDGEQDIAQSAKKNRRQTHAGPSLHRREPSMNTARSREDRNQSSRL